MRIPSIPGFDQQAFEKYLRNTGWLLMAKVGSLVINMLVTTFALSAYLGTTGNGILNYPMAIVVFFMAISALGLDGFVTRELLNHPERSDSILGTAFWMRLVAGIASIPLVVLTYGIINHFKAPEAPLQFVLIVAFTSVVQSVNIIDSFFQARIQAKKIMLVQVSGNIISAFIKFVLIILKMPLAWFVYSLLLDAVIIGAGYIIVYLRTESIRKWVFDKNQAVYLLKNSWPLMFSAVLITIYMKIDQLMIAFYLKADQLGIYSTVVRLSESWYFFPVAVVGSVFPSIMNARKADPERYQKRLQNMYDLMVIISVSIALVTTFASKYIYRIAFHRHPEYWVAAPVLSVHIWAGVFVFLGIASGQYLIAEGYTRLAMVRTGMGAIVNVVLNIFLIPRFGIMGAAYATLAAYGVATFFIVFITQTRRQGLLMFKSLFLISLFQKLLKR